MKLKKWKFRSIHSRFRWGNLIFSWCCQSGPQFKSHRWYANHGVAQSEKFAGKSNNSIFATLHHVYFDHFTFIVLFLSNRIYWLECCGKNVYLSLPWYAFKPSWQLMGKGLTSCSSYRNATTVHTAQAFILQGFSWRNFRICTFCCRRLWLSTIFWCKYNFAFKQN